MYFGISIIVLSWFLYNSVYDSGFDAGKAEVLVQWNKEKVKYLNDIEKLQIRIVQKEKQYREINTAILLQLKDAKKDYEIKLSNFTNAHAIRMHNLRARIKYYQHQSESGAIERRDLADHAAKLDRQLTEGIKVVEELKALVELRDKEIQELGSLLLNERKLLEK